MIEQNLPHPAFQKLLADCKTLPPVITAIVHPCDTATLLAVAEAEKRALITPVLVGPKAKILKAAAEAGVDISAYPLIDTPHSHASAEAAIALVRQGKAAALMKGSLHTDELLEPALDRDGHLGRMERAAMDLALLQTIPVHLETGQFGRELRERKPGIDQGPEHHVAADA